MDAGIHHASVEYRLLKHAPFPASHDDAVRALQFIRSKANEWGIDKSKVAAYGGSAGAQLVAYLAWGDDFANPKSEDPVARESTRLVAVAPLAGQSNMDLNWWVDHIPGCKRAFHPGSDSAIDRSGVEARALVKELSIITHISPDDPPTYMNYGMNPNDSIPEDHKRARGWSIHHINFGLVMEERLQSAGVDVYLNYPKANLPFESDVEFLMHHLKK